MKARLVSVLASMTLAAAVLAVAAPAQADSVPPEQQLYIFDQGLMQNPSANTVDLALVALNTPDQSLEPGSYVDVTWSSCGQVIHASHHTLLDVYGNGDTAFEARFSDSVKTKIGQRLDWAAIVVHPGSEPYVISSFITATVRRPSCDTILNGDTGEDPTAPTTITVTEWSDKKVTTAAKVGKTLKVTPTRAAGAKVVYRWRVGTKTVDRDRAMTVKKAYQGKKVTMRVTVSKAGAKSVSKTLRYGTAR